MKTNKNASNILFRLIGQFALMIVAGAFSSQLWAKSVSLNSVEFAALPGDEIEVRLAFDGPAPEVAGYTIEKPARISLDLLDAGSKLTKKNHALGGGNARNMTVVEAKDRTRVVFTLDQLTGYSTRSEGNLLYVTIGASQKGGVADAAGNTPKEAPAAVDRMTQVSAITDLDFRRGPQGDGQIVISLSDSSMPVDVREEAGRIYVEFVDAQVPEKLRRRLDVGDFATPVKFIDTLSESGNALVVIEPQGDYEYLAYQTDTVFTVNVKQMTAAEVAKRKKDAFVFTGEKLSLNFQNIEVRSVLQLIADFTSLNLVASDSVTGSITLRLQNVPWDQALELILKTKGLDKRVVGNVMLVAPADEIAAREKLELEANKQVEALAPLKTEFIQINYAKAGDIKGLITADGGLLTNRGTVSVDQRTNTLIVQDTVAKLEEIRGLITQLDVPVRQVLIEARVVLATSDFANEFGVRWGGLGFNIDDRGQAFSVSGDITNTTNFHEGYTDPEDDGTFTYEIDRGNGEDMIVDLGASAGATRFAIGVSEFGSGLIEMELSALERDGHAEIVATPKVLTADQQTAKIASGSQIPYRRASSSGATAVEFAAAELSLEVTPHITPDGKIIMDLRVTNDDIGEVVAGVPTIDTNRVTSSVLVDDGETVVLGGIYSSQNVKSVEKTPFFGDLPIVGRLFRRDIDRESKAELLIFVTPKLVKDSLASS